MKINEIIRKKERSLVIDTKAGCRLFRRINSCSSQMGKRQHLPRHNTSSCIGKIIKNRYEYTSAFQEDLSEWKLLIS